MKQIFFISWILFILTGCSLGVEQTFTETPTVTPAPPTVEAAQNSPTATIPSTVLPLPIPTLPPTASPAVATTLTPTPAPKPLPANAADGLIYENNFEWRVIEGEGSRRFLPCERPSLAIFSSVYPAPNFQMFSVEDGQLMIGDRCLNETAPFINLPNRNVRRIWGQVNDWLLVESGEPGISGQSAWPLTAVRLDGTDYQILTEPFFGLPIISPDGYVFIPLDEQVLRWDGKSLTNTEYAPFLSGSFSPDGQLLALIHKDKLTIYDTSGKVVQSRFMHPVGLDSPPPRPVWHPSGEWEAVESWDNSADGFPLIVHLFNMATGEEQIISQRDRPQFSPDGRWLAVYYHDGSPRITLLNLDSWESYEITPNGWPVAWITLGTSAIGPLYTDEALNFSVELPASWTAVHANGATTIRNQGGEPQLRVRSYFSRSGFIPARRIAENSAPPATRDSLTLTETTIANYPAVKTNTAVTYINVGGRHLAFETLGDDPVIPILLETLQAERTDFEDNYILLSSENWIAELSGGANVTETLTVQRRNGEAGYMLFTEPATQGLGYTLAEPLFFSHDEQFLYYNHRGIADGCGIYFGSGDLAQVDLSSGVQTTLENTAGVRHTLSPDGQRIAFFGGRLTNEFTLYLYDLNSGRTETVSFPLPGVDAAAGSLLFSPDGTQMAFAAQQAHCGEGWTIGMIDVATAVLTTYPADDLAFSRPIDWIDDVLMLRPFTADNTKYLDLITGEFLNERP